MTKRKRVILLSVMTMMLCLALVASGTYALFTDDVTLTTHLRAGTLDITLTRVKLETKVLDNETGFLVDKTNNEVVDFSTPNNENVFDIKNKIHSDPEYKELIVPGCSYKATMHIDNGTDVAYAYWVEVVAANPDDVALAKQLRVTVVSGDKEVSQNLTEGFLLGYENAPIAILPKNTMDEFTVTLEFIDYGYNDINNAAMSQTLSFDIVVHAVQVTEAP